MEIDMQIDTRIERGREEIYKRIFSPEIDYIKFYADEMRSIDNDRAINLIDFAGRMENLMKEIYERYGGKIIIIEIDEDLRKSNIWLEWRTEGQIFSRILGHKKSYRFNIPIPPIIICNYEICKHIDLENLYPSFEIFMDFIDIYIEKERKHYRKFFDNKGKIKINLIIEDIHSLERKIYRLGEIEIYWISHHEIDRLARKKLHRIRNLIKKMKERGEKKGLRKLQKKLEKYLRMSNKQWIGGLRIKGRIGELDISRIMLKPRRSRRKINLLAPASIKSNLIESLRFNIRIARKEELRNIIDGARLSHSFIIRDRANLYGFHGKINHEIKIVGIPKRKMKLYALSEIRAWRYHLRINKHPIRIYEYIREGWNGMLYERKKIWIIEPLDDIARFILKNKDHAGEAIDRILIQIRKGEYLIFEHEL